ncbi:glycoside hydrolase superfamily [Butyriboletus roseoflavus]|nr:glycoside hydrolase superfamily [Butyriboletus roseoflavus]
MDGGSLNTAYVAISEYLEPICWMLSSTVCSSGELPLEESSRLLKRRNPYLRYRSSGETPLTDIHERDGQLMHIRQNEPENSNPTYPSCSMPVSIEAQIGIALRNLMDSNGFSSTKIIGYEHNWADAANYPVQLVRDEIDMQQAGSAFDGVSFHCYEGTVSDQAYFTSQYPSKEVFFTECTGTIGSDWWSDIKWYMDNLFIGSINYGSSTGLMWNLALDGTGGAELPGSNSCGGGCRGVVQINNDGTWSVNQEFYAMAQASKAILPRDSGGPWGQRIGVSVGGSLDWALVVGAYVTGRISSIDWNRYSPRGVELVETLSRSVGRDDSASTTWNPQPVTATIEFRGMQATYTFPVGVTTLWWYAAP